MVKTAHRVKISIHAPRMGSDKVRFFACGEYGISIHAPRMGSDQHTISLSYLTYFISIHAPRMGSDKKRMRLSPTTINFNPRSPHGERPIANAAAS